jgi:hypothetical protein
VTFLFAQLYGLDGTRRASVRSFFGVHKITESEDGMFRILLHGTTEHGAQQVRDANGRPLTTRPEPLTYYHADSPLARRSVSAPAASPATSNRAIAGGSTRSIPRWCASRATRPASAISRNARPTCRSCSAMRG